MKRKNLIIPLGVRYNSRVIVTQRDAKTKEVKHKEENHNLLLNYLLERVFANQYRGFTEGMNLCYVGDSDTPASRTDDGIMGNVLDAKDKVETTSSTKGDYPCWKRSTYTFYADTANGTINEIGIGASNDEATARIVLDNSLVNTSDDELEIIYERYLYRSADSYTGVITGGGRNGEDITWEAVINNEQLHNIFFYGFLMAYNERDNIKIGDSNTASSLTDSEDNIKGNILWESGHSPAFYTAGDWVTGQLYRDFQYGFETDELNEDNIKETLLYVTSADKSFSGYDYAEPVARVTFSPALAKTSDYRLYITFRPSVAGW